jgi:hypothetical protein
VSFPQEIREIADLISRFHARPESNQQHARAVSAKHLRDTLVRAKAANLEFFLSESHLDALACLKWMMSVPIYRGLVPESARQFLDPTSQIPAPIHSPKLNNVPRGKLKIFLMTFPPKEKTTGALFAEAQKHFNEYRVSERLFDLVFRALPSFYRRARGETNKTLKLSEAISKDVE